MKSDGNKGPFKVIASTSPCVITESFFYDERPPGPPREYECEHYGLCLTVAAALNWETFTCEGCSGEMDDALLWQARIAARKDGIAQKICKLPHAACLVNHAFGTPALGESPLPHGEGVESAADPARKRP